MTEYVSWQYIKAPECPVVQPTSNHITDPHPHPQKSSTIHSIILFNKQTIITTNHALPLFLLSPPPRPPRPQHPHRKYRRPLPEQHNLRALLQRPSTRPPAHFRPGLRRPPKSREQARWQGRDMHHATGSREMHPGRMRQHDGDMGTSDFLPCGCFAQSTVAIPPLFI